MIAPVARSLYRSASDGGAAALMLARIIEAPFVGVGSRESGPGFANIVFERRPA